MKPGGGCAGEFGSVMVVLVRALRREDGYLRRASCRRVIQTLYPFLEIDILVLAAVGSTVDK